MRLPSWLSHHLAALRALLVFTVLLGFAYPLALVAVARVPGLAEPADGSLVEHGGAPVGSRLLGQSFADTDGNAVPGFFQSRPSAAGDGYDPLSTAASNLGPEDVIDTADRTSLLTDVCARSLTVGEREGLDGSRRFCTDSGVGAVLGVFYSDGLTGSVTRVVSLNETEGEPFVASYAGMPVELAEPGGDYAEAVVVPVRGDAPATPAVPADAVTASASGLDPHISPAYAELQAERVARERGVDVGEVARLIEDHTDGRTLGFLGEPVVNELELNLGLERRFAG